MEKLQTSDAIYTALVEKLPHVLRDGIEAEDIVRVVLDELNNTDSSEVRNTVSPALRFTVASQNGRSSPRILGKLVEAANTLAEKSIVDASVPAKILGDMLETMSEDVLMADREIVRHTLQTVVSAPTYVISAKLALISGLVESVDRCLDPELRGDLLVYLAGSLKIEDKSGVNLKGRVNTHNQTIYQDPMNEETPAGVGEAVPRSVVDWNLYRSLWGLQRYLVTQAASDSEKGECKAMIRTILNAFETSPVHEENCPTGATHDGLTCIDWSRKYLTSPHVLKEELHDSFFRRQVLVQIAIVLQSDHETDTELREQVIRMIGKTKPRGEEFAGVIRAILSREKDWLAWKKEGCGTLESRASTKLLSDPLKDERLSKGECTGKDVIQKKPVWSVASTWESQEPDARLAELRSEDRKVVPSLSELGEELADDDENVECDSAVSRVLMWKFLRCVRTQQIKAAVPVAQSEPREFLSHILPKKRARVAK